MKKRMIFEEHVAALVMGVMVLLAFVNIISRVISGFSFAFTEELIVYLFVVATMFGAAAGVYRRAHMSLTIVADRFKGKGQIFFVLTSSICCCLVFGLLAFQGVKLVRNHIAYQYLTAVMQMPQWIFTSSLVIGSVLYVFRVVQVSIGDIKKALNTEKTNASEDGEV